MKRLVVFAAVAVPLMVGFDALAEDPFAAGGDALAVKDADGSSSVRARLKLKKLSSDVLLVRLRSMDDSKWPVCTFTGLVLRPAKSKAKHFKLIKRGKNYRFRAALKMKKGQLDLSDKMTRNNLGTCYYPKKTKLEVRVSGVDFKAKVFEASEVYLK